MSKEAAAPAAAPQITREQVREVIARNLAAPLPELNQDWVRRTAQAFIDNPEITGAIKSAVQNRGAPGTTKKDLKRALFADLLRAALTDPNIRAAAGGPGSPIHGSGAPDSGRAAKDAARAQAIDADAAYAPTGPCPECGAETEYGPCDCAPAP